MRRRGADTEVMVILRATRKLHSVLPPSANIQARSDTALGDWYVNRLVVDRRPLLLLVSSTSLLPLVLPARDVRRLPGRLASLVGARLRRCGVDERTIEGETLAMTPVAIGPTIERSVLGIMVDFAKGIPHYLGPVRWDEAALPAVEERLAETPCYAGRTSDRVIFPGKKAFELLSARPDGRG
jgi:hypothetical protein